MSNKGAGNAVLAYEANNDGKIDQQNEIVFTEWDPTATFDMQALRDVFDAKAASLPLCATRAAW